MSFRWYVMFGHLFDRFTHYYYYNYYSLYYHLLCKYQSTSAQCNNRWLLSLIKHYEKPVNKVRNMNTIGITNGFTRLAHLDDRTAGRSTRSRRLDDPHRTWGREAAPDGRSELLVASSDPFVAFGVIDIHRHKEDAGQHNHHRTDAQYC